jgi:hypothetical protein
MSKRLIVYIILINILLSVLIPINLSADEVPWWNENWSFRQEIQIPIDTSDEYTRYQPIDIHLDFNNTCWAKDEKKHSIRIIFQDGEKFIELESQIYDLEHSNNEHLSSCNLVFLIPEQANGNEQYFVYYDDEKKSGPDYEKHVEIDESDYQFKPVQGIGFESSFFKIMQEGEFIYAVNKEGTVLGDKVSQQVTRLKKGAKDISPNNGDQIVSFAFVYWWETKGEWTGISSAEHFVSKEIFTNGNLMVKFGIVSETKDGLLRSTVIYKYYYCPIEDKRLYTHVKHEVAGYPLPLGDEIDVAYVIITCGGIKSNTIKKLNFGNIPPFLHFYSDEERIKSQEFDQYPDYSEWQPIIGKTDDYDLGSSPWLSVDYGETGKAHGIIIDSPNILKSGTDERDGIELQLYESHNIQYPGIDGRFAHLYVMRNAFEEGEPPDEVLPENHVVEFNAEYFTTENGGYPTVEKEAGIYQKLIGYQPKGDDVVDEEEGEKYRLSVYPHLLRSLMFKLRISSLLLRGSCITAELVREGESIGYGRTCRIPITQDAKIDWRNISILRRMIFNNLPSGKYLVKIFLENAIFSKERKIIGYKIVDLKKNSTIHIFCSNQGKISISIKNQNKVGVKNAQIYLIDDNTIIGEAETDINGKAILKAPCGIIGRQYTLNTTYKGFFINKQKVRLGRIRQYIPKKISLNFNTHDLQVNIFNSEGETPSFDIDLSLTSNEMQTPVGLTADSTTDGTYNFKDLYPASYILNLKYELFEIKENISIPDISSFEINLYDLSVFIKDNWNLTPEAPLDVSLKSQDFEKVVVLTGESLSSEEYLFSNIYPGNYIIKVGYKSYKKEKSIKIPIDNNGETSIVFSALFNISTKVLDARGDPLKNTKVIFKRGQKEIEGLSDDNGDVIFSIPPGNYVSKIYFNGELIAERKVDVLYDKAFSVVTTSEPIIPLIVIILSLIILAFASVYAYKKKNYLFFLKILAIVLIIISLVSPWWTIQGKSINSHINSSTNLFMMPAEMITITTNNNISAGEITSLDEAFTSVVDLLPFVFIIGIACILISIIFNRYFNRRIQFLFLLFTVLIFICSIVIFSYAMSELANVTVGSFYGNGNLDINVPGEKTYEIMSSSWGPGLSFYLLLISILLMIFIFYKYIKNRNIQI